MINILFGFKNDNINDDEDDIIFVDKIIKSKNANQKEKVQDFDNNSQVPYPEHNKKGPRNQNNM